MSEICIGLVADSHIPDRRRGLHPDLLQRLREEQVQLILHAGDISLPFVLRELEAIAPVQAVRGNYDFFFWPSLPMTRLIELGGVRIGMTHGHGSLAGHVRDKFNFLRGRYKGVSFFTQRAVDLLPEDVDVVVFGHTHFPLNEQRGRQLIVNPGSCSYHLRFREGRPSFGLLRIAEGRASVEIVELDPARF